MYTAFYITMQAILSEMEVVRKKVLGKPGILLELIKQLQEGEPEMQTKAAEMLFCVVGQNEGRDLRATKQASPPSCLSNTPQQACWF